MLPTLLTTLALILASNNQEARPDILVADFENPDYAGWIAEGDAFGDSPASGTLPGQMAVEGFEGGRLVNSFRGGDTSTGTLTSPVFRLERPHLNFLIGGGKNIESLAIQLLVAGDVVRQATGPNDQPGGSERLDWESWDVSELAGAEATIRIVDHATGGWGHINIDQIVQSDRSFRAAPARREIVADAAYLHLPVQDGAPLRRVRLAVDGEPFREFEIELAEQRTDFEVAVDLQEVRGKTLAVEVDRIRPDAIGIDEIRTADTFPGSELTYAEPSRPRFHFTSRRGWLNDPNGLVYQAGEYHLFYQHNPYGWNWGNMHWGHAVSRDLVRWRELPTALYPKKFGDWAFSGSAVVDEADTSGFGDGPEPPLVLAYTSTGRGECIAYSNDHGRSWTEYEGNPVVRHDGRDPRLVWYEPGKHWVMALYSRVDETDTIAFYSSPDLKTWRYQSRIPGFYECPDLFPIRCEEDPDVERWILYGADGKYLVGAFDGRTFVPESEKATLWSGNFYAAQTFSNAPDGRRIQIGWSRGTTFPGMPFNQQMNIPVELTLHREAEGGMRLRANPVRELESLRESTRSAADIHVGEAFVVLWDVSGPVLDLDVQIDLGDAEVVALNILGAEIRYDRDSGMLNCEGVTAALPASGVRLDLHVLVDRGSIEIFADDGRAVLAVGRLLPIDGGTITAHTRGGSATLRSATLFDLGSSWADAAP